MNKDIRYEVFKGPHKNNSMVVLLWNQRTFSSGEWCSVADSLTQHTAFCECIYRRRLCTFVLNSNYNYWYSNSIYCEMPIFGKTAKKLFFDTNLQCYY